ncbi:hypothetical protein EI42_05851 [Thermosporothrix hazakensis]|jgi:hypothetical protein|uniref:Uncharacterized protein n=1 Tax=Thermosporothrix hazakensis TaxID=644383 RepID=A0A326TVI9_THEHA|nr:hypothetical protein [Thermosporothrix hazakensis]PZW20776.1 hypothetical protein EI42_05851 [Thermosporothrix hazakensis]GCE50456.1 hypothetical protein KTH_53250 [Thermosporothrix hazakensis]
MTDFQEIALDVNIPVLHSVRKDGANVIATRVPLDDVRLQKWGWILSLSHGNEYQEQNDIDTLIDRSGKRYPKVYYLADILNYIEKWECRDWEIGYQKSDDNKKPLLLNTSSGKEERDLQQIIEASNDHLRHTLEMQTIELYNRLIKQSRDFHQESENHLNEVERQLGVNVQQLEESIGKLSATLVHEQSQTMEQLKKILIEELMPGIAQHTEWQRVEEVFEETRERIVREQSQTIEQKSIFLLDSLKESLSQQLTLQGDVIRSLENKISSGSVGYVEEIIDGNNDIMQKLDVLESNIEKQYITLQEDNERLTSIKGLLSTQQDKQNVEAQEIREKLAQIIALLEPEEEQDSTKKDVLSGSSMNVKTRRASTQIERITKDHQSLINEFFNSSKKQADEAFAVVRFINILGAIACVFCLVLSVVMLFFQQFTYSAVLGSIGGIGTTLATILGKLSANTQMHVAEQFEKSLEILNTTYQPIVAQTMCAIYADEDRKQAALDKIIDRLLVTNEDKRTINAK